MHYFELAVVRFSSGSFSSKFKLERSEEAAMPHGHAVEDLKLADAVFQRDH